MKLYQDKLTLPGALPGKENPQPVFRSLEKDTKMGHDGTLSKRQLARYGKACGARCLPYRMQDQYIRTDEPVTLDTVVLENENLRATFLPGLGGRLWSLFSKTENREILFRNPVLQTANLAIRGAWCSGGIEWNLGHTGHHVFTCDGLHMVFVTAPDGEAFLRMYQYEAEHCQVYQMDFHLPDGAEQLAVHVRIENTLPTEQPLYWWTNTAVPLTKGTRIFSATDEILYQTQDLKESFRPDFGMCKMPHQPNLPGVDMSRPYTIPRSLEYFFQNPPEMAAPWEVSCEQDGLGFYERSVQPLRTRKLFCWGTAQGGRHWCDYLSRPGKGDYVEIQAGIAETQVHTATIPARGIVEFTQMFGAFSARPEQVAGDWHTAQQQVSERVNRLLPESLLEACDKEYTQKALLAGGSPLYKGDGRGGLELLRLKHLGEEPFAGHLHFPEPEENDELQPWVKALEGEMLPQSDLPLPYMTDPRWLPLLEELANRPDATVQAKFQLAVSLAENDEEARAAALLEQLADEGSAFAAHARGLMAKRRQELALAEKWLHRAYELEQGRLDVSFAEAYMEILNTNQKYEQAWQLWESLPQALHSEQIRVDAACAAVKTNRLDFAGENFQGEFACIREGAVGLTEMWFEYLARCSCREKGIPYSAEYMDDSLPMPMNMDFRMY